MQAHIMSLNTPSTTQGIKRSKHFYTEVGSKLKPFFLKIVMMHIKLMAMKHRAPCNLHTTSTSVVGSKCQNIFFTETRHGAYRKKGYGT